MTKKSFLLEALFKYFQLRSYVHILLSRTFQEKLGTPTAEQFIVHISKTKKITL